MHTFNLIIAGSRTFSDIVMCQAATDKFLNTIARMHAGWEIVVVSGTENGADRTGEQYAEMTGKRVIRMPANWDKEGRSAGYRRNERMAEIANACIVFWENQFKGSRHMIEIARQKGMPVAVIEPKTNGWAATYYNLAV